MTKNNYLFTSESVSEGHPDKVCDRISDMVVDSYLSKDPYARVACETLTTTNKVILAGETRGPKINKDELITKILSTKIFVGIGLISYSMYLWHYPIFAFARIKSDIPSQSGIQISNRIRSKRRLLLISLALTAFSATTIS